jgi:hypothetical protein
VTTALLTPAAYIADTSPGSYLRLKELPGTPAAARAAAHRAVKREELVRVRRGLYFKGKRTRYGMTKPPIEDVALETLGRCGVGPAGVSAARAFGLTTQVPAVPELASAWPVPTGVPGVRIHKRNNTARRELNYLEIAVLELLRDWRLVSEASWPEITAAVKAKVRDGSIDPAKVLAVARHERNTTAAKAAEELLEPLTCTVHR